MIRLRELDPEVKGIVSSGFSTAPVLSDYRAFGFIGILEKPYQISELCAAVTEALGFAGEGT